METDIEKVVKSYPHLLAAVEANINSVDNHAKILESACHLISDITKKNVDMIIVINGLVERIKSLESQVQNMAIGKYMEVLETGLNAERNNSNDEGTEGKGS